MMLTMQPHCKLTQKRLSSPSQMPSMLYSVHLSQSASRKQLQRYSSLLRPQQTQQAQ